MNIFKQTKNQIRTVLPTINTAMHTHQAIQMLLSSSLLFIVHDDLL